MLPIDRWDFRDDYMIYYVCCVWPITFWNRDGAKVFLFYLFGIQTILWWWRWCVCVYIYFHISSIFQICFRNLMLFGMSYRLEIYENSIQKFRIHTHTQRCIVLLFSFIYVMFDGHKVFFFVLFLIIYITTVCTNLCVINQMLMIFVSVFVSKCVCVCLCVVSYSPNHG